MTLTPGTNPLPLWEGTWATSSCTGTLTSGQTRATPTGWGLQSAPLPACLLSRRHSWPPVTQEQLLRQPCSLKALL